MARVPTSVTVDQQPAGAIPGGFQGRSESAPFDFGQQAARAMETAAAPGRAMAGFGEQLQRTGGVLAQQAIKDQEIQNETEATEAATALQAAINAETERFSQLQGEDATRAFPAFQQRIRELSDGTLSGATNPRVRQMLAGRVGQVQNSTLAAGAQHSSRQTRVASVNASEGAANQAIADGIAGRADPERVQTALGIGLSEIRKISEIAGDRPETLRQREAEYRGRFYSGLIATVAEQDPLAAQRMFQGVRDQLDAGSQVRIENMLSAPVRGRRAAEIVAGVTQPITAPDSPAGVRARIFHAENPAGDARRNPNSTASGPGQITNETWDHYAPRLNLRPEQRNERAAQEAIFDAYQLDARRAIGRDLTAGEQYAAWFLGIGAAKAFIQAPPGTNARELYMQTLRAGGMSEERAAARTQQAFTTNGALLRDGMTAGQVLEAVAGRVGASAPRADTGALLRSAMERAGPDPQLQAAVMAQFNMWQTVLNATQTQERAGLDRRVQDTAAALQQGAQVSIPEADIRRLHPPEQADRILDGLYTAQVAGQVFASVQLATPQELETLRSDLRDGSGPITELLRLRRGTRVGEGGVAEEDRAGDVAARGELRNVLDRRIEERNRQLTADPAQYVLAAPGVREAAQRAAANTNDQQAMRDYQTATLAEQARLGVPESERRVLAKAQAQAIAADLLRSDPAQGSADNPDGPALRLQSLARSYGEAWPRVFQDIVRDGRLPPEFEVLAVIPSAIGQADYARMMAAQRQAGGASQFREAVRRAAPVEEARLSREANTYIAPFTRTALAGGQTGGERVAGMVGGAVENLAAYYVFRGMSASDALQRATDRVVNDKYEILGTMRVPRTTSNGSPLGLAPVQAAQAEVMRALTPTGLADIGGNPQVPPDERRNIAFRAAQRGFWVTNERDNGVVLMMELENGGRLPVRRMGGERVELFFDNLPQPTVQGMSSAMGYDAFGAPTGMPAPAAPAATRTGPLQPNNPAGRPPPPPVQDRLPGERTGREPRQPRSGRWEPPQ
jgi:hypothetical protein